LEHEMVRLEGMAGIEQEKRQERWERQQKA